MGGGDGGQWKEKLLKRKVTVGFSGISRWGWGGGEGDETK